MLVRAKATSNFTCSRPQELFVMAFADQILSHLLYIIMLYPSIPFLWSLFIPFKLMHLSFILIYLYRTQPTSDPSILHPSKLYPPRPRPLIYPIYLTAQIHPKLASPYLSLSSKINKSDTPMRLPSPCLRPLSWHLHPSSPLSLTYLVPTSAPRNLSAPHNSLNARFLRANKPSRPKTSRQPFQCVGTRTGALLRAREGRISMSPASRHGNWRMTRISRYGMGWSCHSARSRVVDLHSS